MNGEEAVIKSPKDAFNYKIGMIHQHFKLVDVSQPSEIYSRLNDGSKYKTQ